jgi:crotonobetainyl-CoA:carnitine CoA-transferase CaiB-like acyl-CoA transferase
MQKNALVAVPVNTYEDLVKSPQFESRGFFKEVKHPRMGTLKYPTVPYQFSETPSKIKRHAPQLGQHNEQIYCKRLGYSKEELTKFKETGII